MSDLFFFVFVGPSHFIRIHVRAFLLLHFFVCLCVCAHVFSFFMFVCVVLSFFTCIHVT